MGNPFAIRSQAYDGMVRRIVGQHYPVIRGGPFQYEGVAGADQPHVLNANNVDL